MLLAFDTASPVVTVAVADGDLVLAEHTAADTRRHGELLAPAIVAVLAEAGVDRRDLTAMAVGVGPGPFTGLRVGLVTARTLAAVLEIPVVGVCGLDVLALQTLGSETAIAAPFRVVTDALRREVHWAEYDIRDGQLPLRTNGPHVDTPAVAAWAGPAVGAGAELYVEHFPSYVVTGRGPLTPSAAALCRWVAAGLPTGPPEPLYLRRPDAAEPGARKTVS